MCFATFAWSSATVNVLNSASSLERGELLGLVSLRDGPDWASWPACLAAFAPISRSA